MNASLFGISGALHLDLSEQPEQRVFFSNLVVKGNMGEVRSHK
jgi:hypothetical protein